MHTVRLILQNARSSLHYLIIILHKGQTITRDYGLLSVDPKGLKLGLLELNKDLLRTFIGLLHDFLRTFSGLSGISQDCLRTFSGLSQDLLRNFSKLSYCFLNTQGILRTFLGISYDFLRTFSENYQDFLRTDLLTDGLTD